jgi:hypothetical protein
MQVEKAPAQGALKLCVEDRWLRRGRAGKFPLTQGCENIGERQLEEVQE